MAAGGWWQRHGTVAGSSAGLAVLRPSALSLLPWVGLPGKAIGRCWAGAGAGP
jgi:hypothetical protein